LKSLFQGGKLSGKSTARRRDSGEFLVKENTKGEAGNGESLRLKDRESARSRTFSVLLFYKKLQGDLEVFFLGVMSIDMKHYTRCQIENSF